MQPAVTEQFSRVAIDRIELTTVSGLPHRYDRATTVRFELPTAQHFLDVLAQNPDGRVYPKVEVNTVWADGARHRLFYRLGKDVCLRGKILRYFMMYAGYLPDSSQYQSEDGKLLHVIPPNLRKRYQGLLQTHRLD